MFTGNVYLQVFGSLVGTFVSLFAWNYLTSPIKNIPGPFLAKCTNWWRLFGVYDNTSVHTQRRLHEKYGSAVQLGPNLVSLSDPSLIKTIYTTRGEYLKGKFYDPNSAKVGRKVIHNVFSTRSNAEHARFLRPVRKFFTISSLLKTEPLIDETISLFLSQLDARFATGDHAFNTVCKMDEWLPHFAYDVIGHLTWGAPIGYLEHGSDFDKSQEAGVLTVFYFAVISQIPELDSWLAKNPVMRIGPPAFTWAAILCGQKFAERKKELEDGKWKERNDMLDDFIRINREDPKLMDDDAVVGALIVNVLAGGDTTGIMLCSVLYYVLKDKKVYRKLMEELDAANLEVPVSWASAEKLKYFEAVFKEASRIHPGVGMILERIVPAEGLILPDGRAISPGTVVGMNAWVVHQDKEIFGEDAAVFNPDRWLRAPNETEEEHKERVINMNHHDLTFGAGKRICMGRSVSILETYKVMTTLFLTYEMELVDPSQEWYILYSWFTKQSDINVRMRRRKRAGGPGR